MKIGDKIKILRELKNISSKHMADELNMSLGGYLKIERNDVDINTEKIEKVSNILNIKPSELLNLDEKHIFNFSHNEIKTAVITSFNFPEEMKQLYEDKVKLLEDKISYLQDKIRELESKEKS